MLIVARVQGPVDHVTLVLDGVAQEEGLPTPYEYTWDTTQLPEGPHTVQARATRGDEVVLSESRVVNVDRTPPVVVTRSPEPGAKNVAISQRIEMTFSEPIAAETLTSESVRLLVDSQPRETSRTLSSDGSILTIVPTPRLEVPSSPSVELASSITDLAGNPLVIPSAAWNWKHPSMLFVSQYQFPSSVSPPFQIGLALDESDNPLVSAQDDGITSAVNHWTGTGWSPVGERLPLEKLAIQRHGDGSIFAAGRTRQYPQHILVQRWSASGWLTLEPALGPATHDFHLSLSLTSQKKLGIAWAAGFPAVVEVRIRGTSDWVALGSPLTTHPGTNALTPVLRLDDSGKHVVAWTQDNSIHVRRWNNESWETLGDSPNTRISTPVIAKQPSIVLRSDGSPVIAWLGGESSTRTAAVYIQEWDGVDWKLLGTPLKVNEDELSPAFPYNPIIHIDPTGRPVVGWSEQGMMPQSTFTYVRRWDGIHWTAMGDTHETGVSQTGEYNFVLDSQGSPVLACLDFDPNHRDSWLYILRQNH
ncbi:Ig-like domain-containing protein [Myxococcus sp. K15C18031901]|nr:Ig-like domain-containing protein [Myxococcus dinghuensis]